MRASNKMFNTVALAMLYLVGALAAPVVVAESLVVYSGRSDKFVKPVMEAFTEKTGIEVVIHSGKSTELLNKLRVEGKRTEADLFLSNDAGNLQVGSELGLFMPINDKAVREIPANYRGEDNKWIGLSARARVLVVNSNADLDWVKGVFDLADPRLDGRLAITHSANESYIAGVTVYLEAAGDKAVKAWLKGMKSNVNSQVFDKHSKIVKAVASGEKDIGLVNHYYIYRYLDNEPDAPIEIVFPDQRDGMGVAWNVAGVAVSKYTDNKGAAVQLVRFLASPEGQRVFAEVNREYPTLPGVAAASEVPAAGSYKVADVPMGRLGSERNRTLDVIEAVGMP